MVRSLIEGSIDAGPLDAYWHALLRLHEPETAARLRMIARTEEAPIPCFVTSSETPSAVRERLVQAFVDAPGADNLRGVFADLALRRFVPVSVGAYEVLAERAHEVDALGYARLN